MNKHRLFVCILIGIMLITAAGSVSAAGSLKSHGEDLWNYYSGRSMSYVRNHAPMFEKIEGYRYLLDYEVIEDVELYLTCEFENDRLVLLQIMTPYPDYLFCNDSIKEMSYTFAAISTVMMGFDFDVSEQCHMSDDNEFICIDENNLCIFDSCPKEMGYFVCSSLEYFK